VSVLGGVWGRQDREIILKERPVKLNMVHFSFSETVERNMWEAFVWTVSVPVLETLAHLWCLTV